MLLLPSTLWFVLGDTIVIAVAMGLHLKASSTIMPTINRRFITATSLLTFPDSGRSWGQDRAFGRLAQRQTLLAVGQQAVETGSRVRPDVEMCLFGRSQAQLAMLVGLIWQVHGMLGDGCL
jgi:hypothetical protein